MRKIKLITKIIASIMLATLVATSLIACSSPEQNQNNAIVPSSQISSTEVSSEVSSMQESSQPTSSEESSQNDTSSKSVFDELTSNAASSTVSSKATTSSKPTSSKPATSKPATSSKPTSSKPATSSKPVSSAPPVSSATQTPNTGKDYTMSQFKSIEDDLIAKVNELRASKGLAELKANSTLKKVAALRSKEMTETGYFEHKRPDGSEYATAFDEIGYAWARVGENIAYCSGYSEDEIGSIFFDGWLNSPGHYANMVRAEYTEIGIAIYTDGTKYYATQSFGIPK